MQKVVDVGQIRKHENVKNEKRETRETFVNYAKSG